LRVIGLELYVYKPVIFCTVKINTLYLINKIVATDYKQIQFSKLELSNNQIDIWITNRRQRLKTIYILLPTLKTPDVNKHRSP